MKLISYIVYKICKKHLSASRVAAQVTRLVIQYSLLQKRTLVDGMERKKALRYKDIYLRNTLLPRLCK